MKLTDTTIRAAMPGDKVRKLFDGGGLFLQVNRDGSRWWRFKYRYGGKDRGCSAAESYIRPAAVNVQPFFQDG